MNGVGIAGQNGIPKGLVDNHWDTFAPRIGFAYDLTGRQKTILRAGAGIFYERIGGNEEYNMGQSNIPFAYKSAPTQVYFDNPATSYTSGLTAAVAVLSRHDDDGTRNYTRYPRRLSGAWESSSSCAKTRC